MSYDMKLPSITSETVSGRVDQLQSYIYQMVSELNWALNTIESGAASSPGALNKSVTIEDNTSSGSVESAIDTFNRIKALIIKSADIVEAYEQKLTMIFNGKYVAKSVYGDFAQETTNKIELSDSKISTLMTKVQTIDGSLTEIDGYVVQNTADISANAEEISKRVTQTVFNQYGQTVDNKFSEVIQNADGLQLQINSLTKEIDGSMYVYNVEEEPTLLNYPAWDFTKNIPCNNTVQVSDTLKFEYTPDYYKEHLRDLAFDETLGLTYRFSRDGDVFDWSPVSDTEFGLAMNKIAELKIQADGLSSQYSAQQAQITSQGLSITSNTSNISQQADRITTEVAARSSADGDLSSRISQTAKSIELSVTDPSDANRKIGITIKVKGEDGAVKQTETKDITLTGNVIFKSDVFDATNNYTTINGNKITTGSIGAEQINTSQLKVGDNITFAPDATINWDIINKPTDLVYTANATQITKDTVTAPFIEGLNLKVGNEIQMGDNATIKWDKVTDKDSVITDSNKSTKITKDYIESLNIIAENISGTNIDGKTITGSTITGNTISGGTISGASISGNTISGGTITGTTISGNTISGGSISGTAISGGSVSGATIKSTNDSDNEHIEISGGELKLVSNDGYGVEVNGDSFYVYNSANRMMLLPFGLWMRSLSTNKDSQIWFLDNYLSISSPVKAPAFVQSGSLSVGSTPQSVRFSQAFASIPNVVATFSTNSNTNPSGANGTIRIFQKTTSGFVIQAPSCTTAQNVCWIATV